jgi:hypothetical protein
MHLEVFSKSSSSRDLLNIALALMSLHLFLNIIYYLKFIPFLFTPLWGFTLYLCLTIVYNVVSKGYPFLESVATIIVGVY